MKTLAWIAPLSLLLLAADPPKQTAPTFLETLEVTISNVDVVVTDKQGHSVRGLRRDDFDIRENGAPQPITNFAEYGTSSGTTELNVPAPAAAPATPAAEAAVSAPPARKFVFFVDEMSIHPDSRGKLLRHAHDFIETAMRDGDEALILTPANAMSGKLTFSPDRAAIDAQLRSLIEKSKFRSDTPTLAEQFFYQNVVQRASGEERRAMARIYATKVNRRVTSTLRSLLGVVGSMTQTEGKKVLVVMTESLPAEPGKEAFGIEQSLAAANANITPDEFSGRTQFDTNTGKALWFDARPMIRELGARATANGITIYSIQPDPGVVIAPPGLAAGSSPPRQTPIGLLLGSAPRPTAQSVSSAGPAVSAFQRDLVSETATTLGSLADATGGKFWSGEGELGDAFRTMANDIDSYYSIGYRVAESVPNSVRKIAVAVKNRPDLVVRTRRDVLRYSPDREMDEIATAELLTTKNVNELGISAAASKPSRTIDAYKIDVAVKIPLEKLTFIPQGDKYEAEFSVHYAAADGANYTTGQMRQQTLRVPAGEIDAVRRHTYTYTSTLVVAPGTARISVGVFDKLSRLSGFQKLEVMAR